MLNNHLLQIELISGLILRGTFQKIHNKIS